VFVVVLFLRRSWPFIVRVLSVILLSYILGTLLLAVIGPFGAGPVWLFFFPVITGLLLEFRYAIASLVINSLTLIFFGWLFTTHFDKWSASAMNPLESWIVIGLNFLLLNIIATISIVMVVRGLEASLIQKKMALELLEGKNTELQDANLTLTNEIYAKQRAEQNLQKSEEALKASEMKSRDLVHMLPLGHFLIDSDLTLQFLNRKAIDIFGFSSAYIGYQLERESLTIVIPEDRQKAMDTIVNALNGEDSGWTSLTALTKQGQNLPIEANVTAVYNQQRIVGVQGLIVDISDRLEKEKFKNAKDIAEKTNSAISEWVGFIAHEIRTPISAPLSYSKLGLKKLDRIQVMKAFSTCNHLLERLSTADSEAIEQLSGELSQLEKILLREMEGLAEYFNRIFNSSDRLNLLLNELLDMSKLESGQMRFEMKEANMSAIVEDAVFELEATALEKNLRLEVARPDFITQVECDSFRIGQLVRNLLSNAIKFTPESKKIAVSFEESDIMLGRREYDNKMAALKVTVADEGIGIPPDQISSVFEKFKQSRKTRKGEGTGLGLPICREIITAHGGKIWLENNKNVGGTLCHFSIPYKQRKAIKN